VRPFQGCLGTSNRRLSAAAAAARAAYPRGGRYARACRCVHEMNVVFIAASLWLAPFTFMPICPINSCSPSRHDQPVDGLLLRWRS